MSRWGFISLSPLSLASLRLNWPIPLLFVVRSLRSALVGNLSAIPVRAIV